MKKVTKKKPCVGLRILRLFNKLLFIGALFFVSTFTIYMFNLDNKLIYRVIRPVLNRHYDAQVRDRRI
ncbi:hypothetical protein [Guggenheimella bovis]